MTRNSHRRLIRNIIRIHTPFVEPPSAELERGAMHQFGDRDGPAVKAIFHARRNESMLTFFVKPLIAAAYGLSQRAMTRSMDRLEGCLIETVYKERGALREIRLLPDWENPQALASDITRTYRRASAEAVAANREAKQRSEIWHCLYPDLSHPPEVLAKLRSLLDPPSDP